MVIDTSALIAILQAEPGFEELLRAIESAEILRVSAASVLEASAVLQSRFGEGGERELDALLHRLGAETVAFSQSQLHHARRAYRTFGKGNHPAGLNYGDCFSYALAASLGERLLFVGRDFSQTDVLPALS